MTTPQAPASTAYRPQLRWLLLGPLLGAGSGSLVAFVFLLIAFAFDGTPPSATELLAGTGPTAVLAVVLGGPMGAAVGLLAAVPLALLVGRHLPRPVARRRAFVLGAALPPVAMVALFSLVSGRFVLADVDLRRGGEWLGLTWFVAAAVLGGPLAARATSRVLPHTDAS
ncbi:hypothetical protein [uncultured Nocardioides sp.]|uniref:hypothetical protein n=1 Tax=uncultured Nocardioides sp. TaxID=198441 RepID=UPI0026250429|nr:hypothetical protein [uncultured Nocardioides sp.]